MHNCYFARLTAAPLAEVLCLLPCLKTSEQHRAWSSSTSSSLCSLSNMQRFFMHSKQAVTASGSCLLVDIIKADTPCCFSCPDCGWRRWSCTNTPGEPLKSHSSAAFCCTLLQSCSPILVAARPVFIHPNVFISSLSRNGSMMSELVLSQAKGTTSKPAPSLWLSMWIRLVRRNNFWVRWEECFFFSRGLNLAKMCRFTENWFY